MLLPPNCLSHTRLLNRGGSLGYSSREVKGGSLERSRQQLRAQICAIYYTVKALDLGLILRVRVGILLRKLLQFLFYEF